MSVLSLGGLPPFLGFLPKWIVIQTIITNNIARTTTSCYNKLHELITHLKDCDFSFVWISCYSA
jgi:NADH-ubiquinone oxidoreductase chain 2